MSKKSKYDLFSMAGGLAKKVITSGEENLRKGVMQVWDLKGISKDLVDGLIARAVKQKDVIIAAMTDEFSKFLRRIDVSQELQKLLSGLTIDVHATIELKRTLSGKSVAKFSQKARLAKPNKSRKEKR